MINLITGVPGSGKTVQALNFMLEKIGEGRPLFVHGIPNLSLPHVQVVCISPSCEVCPVLPCEPVPPEIVEYVEGQDNTVVDQINDSRGIAYDRLVDKFKSDMDIFSKYLLADEWHLWAPDGAIIFYDEVQNVYRPRSSSSKVPPSVSAFETHRHKGLDFYLVTQSPLLFDGNIRRLVGKHIHLRPTWAGRYQYEFPECNDNPKNVTSGIKSKYKLNKKVFSLFKSAEIHTKQSKAVPFAAYLLVFLFVGMALLANRVYSRMNSLTTSAETVVTKTSEVSSLVPSIEIPSVPGSVITRKTLLKWSSNGINPNDYDLVPQGCVFSKTTVKCPPFTISSSVAVGLGINRLCIINVCYYLFSVQRDSITHDIKPDSGIVFNPARIIS